MKDVPEIGNTYILFEDGKINPGRLYKGTVVRVLSVDESKKEIVLIPDNTDGSMVKRTLYDVWKEEIDDADFLFSTDTDYFVEIVSQEFDENNLWAVRTKPGGWFTMNIQSDWQGCEVDVDGSMAEQMMEKY